jgi:L-threonylcarbamoyladenylate synthase
MNAVMPLGESDARHLEECLASGGVAVFPADTVYGLCCDPENETAVRRLYALKGRPAERPAAVMFFDREIALRALPELVHSERAALEVLLPGPVTLLLPNRERRFPLACGPRPDASDPIGLRVPLLDKRIEALSEVKRPLLQSSANLSGGADARCLADVPLKLRTEADLVLDGGELPGTPSTVIDLRDYQQTGEWQVVREGALGGDAVRELLTTPG